uniref:Toll-like receptor 6 n=1 Tax=Bos taurus TaxID=9913 RepID=Q704V7_BOVIN|nr:Toll-like receptor 6 [Bos taurus]
MIFFSVFHPDEHPHSSTFMCISLEEILRSRIAKIKVSIFLRNLSM